MGESEDFGVGLEPGRLGEKIVGEEFEGILKERLDRKGKGT